MPPVLRTALVCIAALLTLALPSHTSVGQSSSEVTVGDTVSVNPSATIEIENQSGRITVSTWDQQRVSYRVTLRADSGHTVEPNDLTVARSESRLSLSTVNESWSLRIPGLVTISPEGVVDPSADIHVTMPATARLEIDDYDSRINVGALRGDTAIETYSGTVSVDGIDGNLELETYSGSTLVTGLDGSAQLETYSGDVTVSFDELSAESSIDAYAGALDIFLPHDAGFVLVTDLGTASLNIDEAFTLTTEDEDTRAYNGGGPELSVELYSGTVEVHARGQSAASTP